MRITIALGKGLELMVYNVQKVGGDTHLQHIFGMQA